MGSFCDIILLDKNGGLKYEHVGGEGRIFMKEIISEAVFRKQMKMLRGAYLFFGEEDYLKQNALSLAARTLVGEDAAAFDYIKLDDLSFSPESLTAALAPPPMLGEWKLVVLTLNINELRAAEISGLIEILGALEDDEYNVLIINVPSGGIDAGTAKRPGAALKKLCEFCVGVRFDRVTPARLAGWCARHYSENGVRASEKICNATIEYCSTDMFILSNEIDKISFYVLSQGRDEVSEGDIYGVASSSLEFDSFALANAVLAGDTERALSVLAQMKAQKTEPVRIAAELSRVICDMQTVYLCTKSGMTAQDISTATGIKPYPLGRYLSALKSTTPDTLSRAVSACSAADAALKSWGRGYVPIEQLICTI